MRVVALLMVLLFAGCQSPAPTDGPKDEIDGAKAIPNDLYLDDCIHQLAFVGVSEEDASARLPEGFRPVLLAGGLARLIVLATSCTSVDNLTQDMREMLFGLVVAPPDRFAREDVAFHAFYMGLMTIDPAVGTRYAQWGVPVRTGTVSVEVQTGEVGTGVSTAGDARLTTTAGGMPEDGPAGAVRIFFQAEAIGAVDYDFTPYRMVLGAARFEDPQGLAGFGSLETGGYGVHEWGDPYGLVLTRVLF